MITPLTQITGVPDALIVALNTRLRQIGTQADASTAATGTGGGAPTPAPTPTPLPPAVPVGDVLAVHAYGEMDPILGVITLGVSITPPADPLFEGCHLYLEVPDQSGSVANTVGVATVGVAAVGGAWAPIDLGVQPYTAGTQPWVLTLPVPPGVDPTLAVVSRAYASSVSSGVDNPLVRANAHGATPNAQLTLYPAVAGAPSGATNVTQLCGPIVPLVLPNDNSTGKLQTPVLVTVSTAPANIPGWSGQLILVWAGSDPTQPANQTTVGNVFTAAGPIYGSPDKIPIPHSFAVLTPTTVTNATIYALSGLVDAHGNYQWNNLVPGITPSCGITVGVTTGTTDASSVMASTIAASMAVVTGLFGVAPAGITNALLGSAAVATINIQALAVTNPLLASLCVQAAQLASGSVTATAIGAAAVGTAAIQNAAITNALIANLAVSGAQIQLATILGANIAFATIADANIGTCGVSKLTAGTATFTGTATFSNSSGPSVAIASGSVTLTAGANTTTLTASGGILLQNGTYSAQITSGLVALSNGSFTVQLNASGIALNSTGYSLALTAAQIQMVSGASSLTLTASLVTLQAASGASITLSSGGVATFTGSGTTTTVTGNFITTGTVFCTALQVSTFVWDGSTFSSATAGSDTLPSNPAGFIVITVGASTCKMPYYNF